MKTNYLISFLLLFTFKATIGLCTQHTIVSSGLTFSPSSINANVGDTVIFSLSSIHTVVQVDQATWNANANTSNGGFQLPNGGGMIVVTTAQTYYYVCGVHYAMGMKGTLVVALPTGINTLTRTNASLEIFPNPVSSGVTIRTNLPAGKENQITIFDMTGKSIYQKSNISSSQYLDLSGVSSGVYFLALKYDDISIDKKLIISR